MLQNLPFIGSFPISQAFGDHPAHYAGFGCGNTPLRGHNGLDFPTPPGTPVIAVQAGVVLSAGTDPGRFGHFVLLGHEWGQSLYAHLGELRVGQGQQVAAGQPLGVSGNSGRSTAPHLHFGLRIAPFSVADGWCGYSDPQPYLDRLTQPRGSIIGPHIIGGVHQHLDLLRRWQPRLILALDPNPEEMVLVREACPNTVIIGRVFEPDGAIDSRIRANPQEAARWAHDKVMSRFSPAVNYWQFANEILQREDGLPLLNAFELARMELAEANGYRCAILAFSVGNPDLPEADRMAMWRIVYPALERAEQQGHVVAVHQYGAPDLFSPALDWYAFRLEHQVLRRLPYKRVQFAVTEYGIDGLIDGRPQPTGWQGFTEADGYVEQLLRAGRYLERFSGRVLGYAVFTLGHNAPWGSYDIAGSAAEALAARSERGSWSQINTEGHGLVAGEGDQTSEPGGTPIDNSPPPPDGGPDGSPDGEKPEPEKPVTEPPPPLQPVVEQRLTGWFTTANMRIRQLNERPDGPGGDLVYLVKDVFTTTNGSWEPAGEATSIPQWARDTYLAAEFLEAGADHHLFARVLDLDGKPVKNHEILFWSDGFEKLGDPGYTGYVRERTKESSGWANMFMGPSSSFVPERGESGPWCWAPAGAAEVVCGGGLPANHHVSTFAVWQAVRRADLEQPPVEPEKPVEPEPPIEPEKPVEPEKPTPQPPAITRRIGDWIQPLNVRIRTLEERPDRPQGDIVYLVKDIFTTRDGSWDPSNQPGSVNQWARESYLKPWGAPDYFDDAGADHHLFAAVLGLDGQLLRDYEIRYWSDGFDKLADPNYQGYVFRQTKSHSGWANIVTGPGSNFVPERGESGPWCWAPAGAAEVVCGGGMPAKQHVSFFVVWQAVRRSEGQPGPQPKPGDFDIFLPIIGGGMAAQAATAELPPSTTLVDPFALTALAAVRAAAWTRLGIEYRPDSALADYARRNALGMPVTQEFTVGTLVVQGFQGGIVYAASSDRSSVRHMSW
jgi:hypothetical protein